MSFPLWECVFTTSTPINVKGYTLTTGNDTGSFPDRNPKKWTLEAKATSGGNWTTIDSRDVSANSGDALPAANTAESKVYAVASDKQGSYQFFRFKVSEAGGTIMQLGELKLQGINFGEGYYTTGIISTTNYTNSTNSDAWYTLDGHKLDGKPTAKGIYVNNGKKVVIK